MDAYRALVKRRTIRRFQEKKVPFSLLKKCVNAARMAPTARNWQPLEFVAVSEKSQVKRLNEAVHFGGSVKEKGRKKGEGPKAFIVIAADKEKYSDYTKMDVGIAAQSIVLTAWEAGLGACMMGAIERERVKGVLGIPKGFEVPLAIALGFPKEKPKAEKAGKNLFYWVDEKGELHIPKRSLEKVLHRDRF